MNFIVKCCHYILSAMDKCFLFLYIGLQSSFRDAIDPVELLMLMLMLMVSVMVVMDVDVEIIS